MTAHRCSRTLSAVGVVWFEAASAERALLGGKGANLVALRHAGLPVPPGFVLPPPLALDVVQGADAARREVAEAWRQLTAGGKRVAVRSSAVAEDAAEASFAGQFETVLGVGTEEELWRAIERCVASEGEQHAEAYREAVRASGRGMAVVVQELVEARAAGVAFTVDPASGREHVVVEAVRGLGDALVSGAAAGERWEFRRPDLEVAAQPERPAALSEAEARRVAELALQCEALFGAPQDIEFAVDERGDVWLLQSRPVTRVGRSAPRSEFDTETSDADEWTSANVQEVLPGLLTPLTISVFREASREAYTRNYQRLRILSEHEWPEFTGFFWYRAFLNLGALRTVADRTPGGNADALEHRFFGGEGNRPRPLRARLRYFPYKLRCALPLARELLATEQRVRQLEEVVARAEQRTAQLPLPELSDAELERHRQWVLLLAARWFHVHLDVSGLAGAGFEAVAQLIRPLFGDETEGVLPRLFTGLPDVESAAIALDTWKLTELVREFGLEERVRSADFDPTDPGLPEPWREAFAAFLRRHGHRGVAEMEASARTWRRDPTPVIATIRSYLELSPEQAPPRVLERQEQARLELTRTIEQRLNPIARQVFRFLLPRAQRWVALREWTKSLVVRHARLVDPLVEEIARRLVARGVLADTGDVFFLTNEEIEEILFLGPQRDYRERVHRRRREFEMARHFVLPERFRGYPTPEVLAPAGDGVTELRGTPVSPGVVVGKARVVLDPQQDAPLQPGEILVAPVTDAGWTPLFALASGLVVDIGSALSHGSTVAREYGLPAVANVRTGTRVIRTGDLLQVDGNEGVVRILERSARPDGAAHPAA